MFRCGYFFLVNICPSNALSCICFWLHERERKAQGTVSKPRSRRKGRNCVENPNGRLASKQGEDQPQGEASRGNVEPITKQVG